MPPGREAAPVAVSIYNILRNERYWEHSHSYNDTKSAINTNAAINPDPGDMFGLHIELLRSFEWNGYKYVKVDVYVDGRYLRTQYLEARFNEHTLNITKGRKLDWATGKTVQFGCFVGDVFSPGPHELDGTISVELSLGSKIPRRPRQPKVNLVEETATFKHGPSEPVPEPKISKTMFVSAPKCHFTPIRWYFLYPSKTYRSGYIAPVPVPFAGLGKRSREAEEDAQGQIYKRARRVGGLEAEFSPGQTSLSNGQEQRAARRREPVELFPENIGVLYGDKPFYGRYK